MEVRCSTRIDAIRTCHKYLGTFDVLIGRLYCKSCKQQNFYHVISQQGKEILKTL